MKITAHTMVKNEGRFVWYAIMSVVDYVDEYLIYDTGSTDSTKKIIKHIHKLFPKKVKLKFVGDITNENFPQVRQEMLDKTTGDWVLMVDADEIWWEGSIQKVYDEIQKDKLESIVVPTINLAGDMFHKLEDHAGLYTLAGKKGHLALRAINMNIPGLSSSGIHGVWGWVDEKGRMIQDRSAEKTKFIDAPYLHTTFLERSDTRQDSKVPKRKKKLKHEIGEQLPLDYFYPEVLFRKRPSFVPSVWKSPGWQYWTKAAVQTPLKK